MTTSSFAVVSGSHRETIDVGAALANWLQDGDVVLLHGDLGAGKTTLVKGIALALKIDEVVSSPSFSLVNEYDTDPSVPIGRLYHLDLYRLDGADDLASIGFDDFTAPFNGVTVVEWPERAAAALPDRYVLIEIETIDVDHRRLHFVPVPDDCSWTTRFASLRDQISSTSAPEVRNPPSQG